MSQDICSTDPACVNEMPCWACQTGTEDIRKWHSKYHKVGSKSRKSNHSPSLNVSKLPVLSFLVMEK